MAQATQQDISKAVASTTFADGKCRCGGDLVAYGFGVTIPRIILSDLASNHSDTGR